MGLNFLKRNTDDPLIRAFLDKYRLNLLSVPRTDMDVGGVYRNDGKTQTASGPGNIKYLLEPEFKMPRIKRNETMAGISSLISKDHSADVILEFMEGFLNALMPDLGTGIRFKYEERNAKTARFSFSSVTRDYVDPNELGRKLGDGNYKMMENNAIYIKGCRYFIVTGVARSPAINIMAEDSTNRSVNVDVSAAKKLLGEGTANVTVSKSVDGKLTFRGDKGAAFGVELYELAYYKEQNRFLLKEVDRSYTLRGKIVTKKVVEPALIGDLQEGNVFISLEEMKVS